MSIVKNQLSLKNFIETQLNSVSESNNVEFKTDLFNSDYVNYWYEDDLGQKYRYTPVMINDIIGEYLNVPNSNSFNASVGVTFDIFVGINDDNNRNVEIEEFSKVGYTNTLNAIEEFKNSLQAKYYPLGTPYLYFGGIDSTANFQTNTSFNVGYIEMSIEFKNDDDEGILRLGSNDDNIIYKENNKIIMKLNNLRLMELDYGESLIGEKNIKITNDGDTWTIVDLDDSTITDNEVYNFDLFASNFDLGYTSEGLEAILKSLKVAQYGNIDEPDIILDTFDSKDELISTGTTNLTTQSISNCILWSTDGNAIFTLGTLNPISDPRVIDGQYVYQVFEIELSTFISNDVLFGNNFEYHLSIDDGVSYQQVYPVDRNHTLATQENGAQKLNSNENDFIIEESVREHTMSFYYIPNKRLNRLLKHVVSSEIGQNSTYKLKVQYPFFQYIYEVLLENGGTNPNLQTLSTFTITIKKASSDL